MQVLDKNVPNTLKISELESQLQKLKAEYESLPYKNGTVEYKYVRNKIGREYYYYYYRVKEGDVRRSIYLGDYLEARPIIKSLKRARELRKEIRVLEKELKKSRKMSLTPFKKSGERSIK